MEGDINNKGIIQLSMDNIFNTIDENYKLFCSCIEIYNDNLIDLCSNNNNNKNTKEDDIIKTEINNIDRL